jgi:monofunctional biosynthetic peptidoglycan transglycosylase
MASAARPSMTSGFLRWLVWVAAAALALQVFFLGRIAMMVVVDPQSTTFERSEAWRILSEKGTLRWRQNWVPYAQIPDSLKRAVIASEDGDFVNHDGVEWEAIQKAWDKNARAEDLAAKRTPPARPGKPAPPAKAPKIIGGSTITQQLAKNLLLSGERTFLRKGQEFLLTVMLELLLPKQRILEIYLNNVEWGEGVFGAEAAAQHYYRKPAAKLGAYEAARLAVMLPRPKYFEKVPNSPYLSHRAGIIVARMGDAELP